jgi:hypothetical protein
VHWHSAIQQVYGGARNSLAYLQTNDGHNARKHRVLLLTLNSAAPSPPPNSASAILHRREARAAENAVGWRTNLDAIHDK